MLWVLSELNNTDKHRIIPATILLFSTLTAYTRDNQTLFMLSGNTLLEEDEMFLGTFPLPKDWSDDKVQTKPGFSVEFAQFNFFSGVRWGLGQFLWKIWRRVSDIIDRFETEFFGS